MHKSLPTIDDALISDRFDVSPSPSIREELSDEDVPQCPPDNNDEHEEPPDRSSVAGLSVVAEVANDACSFLSRECVQAIFNESLNQGGVTGSLGATAHPQDDTIKDARQLKGRHSLKGSRVLFEFACDKDSNLGNVGAEHGLQVIRLCKEHVNLEDPASIEQLIDQAKALPGCSMHCSIECRLWSQWQI